MQTHILFKSVIHRHYSIIAIAGIAFILLFARINYPSNSQLNVTTWDALGYYMYLPGAFIYNDLTELKWLESMDKKYGLTGGKLYQANKADNGRYVFKYLGGIAILQAPLFFSGHVWALLTPYDADGFSKPYQYALSYGIIIYCLIALMVLRSILLRFFNDRTTAFSLLLLVLATNSIQYFAIDNAMSHSTLFLLYSLLIYFTIKWHEKPHFLWAVLTGLIIGIAVISRPTEGIMFLIPLLWNTHNKMAAREKWERVWQNKAHILAAIAAAIISVAPQLLYWKFASGSWIYDVGSKWSFLSPFFRVLTGWEKGWFIYTPVSIFFIAGFFFMKSKAFQKAVIWFSLLNIYIVIAWWDWRYGASYSTRALVQSYPVFVLPLSCIVNKALNSKWKYPAIVLGLYLIGLNLFQLHQYNHNVLHYNDMNRKYYSCIYLKAKPSPLCMSLLDTDEILKNPEKYKKTEVFALKNNISYSIDEEYGLAEVFSVQIPLEKGEASEYWLRVFAKINTNRGLWESFLILNFNSGTEIKSTKIRMHNAISKEGDINTYDFFMQIPDNYNEGEIELLITSTKASAGRIIQADLILYCK